MHIGAWLCNLSTGSRRVLCGARDFEQLFVETNDRSGSIAPLRASQERPFDLVSPGIQPSPFGVRLSNPSALRDEGRLSRCATKVASPSERSLGRRALTDHNQSRAAAAPRSACGRPGDPHPPELNAGVHPAAHCRRDTGLTT